MNHIPIQITSEQHKNLENLAQGLAELPDPSLFNMKVTFKQYTKCGTVCCAAGYGPTFGIEKYPDESWVNYCARVYGTLPDTNPDDDPLFDWLFSFGWQHVDNTPSGASKRILYALQYGVPEDYIAQIEGEKPLSY